MNIPCIPKPSHPEQLRDRPISHICNIKQDSPKETAKAWTVSKLENTYMHGSEKECLEPPGLQEGLGDLHNNLHILCLSIEVSG